MGHASSREKCLCCKGRIYFFCVLTFPFVVFFTATRSRSLVMQRPSPVHSKQYTVQWPTPTTLWGSITASSVNGCDGSVLHKQFHCRINKSNFATH